MFVFCLSNRRQPHHMYFRVLSGEVLTFSSVLLTACVMHLMLLWQNFCGFSWSKQANKEIRMRVSKMFTIFENVYTTSCISHIIQEIAPFIDILHKRSCCVWDSALCVVRGRINKSIKEDVCPWIWVPECLCCVLCVCVCLRETCALQFSYRPLQLAPLSGWKCLVPEVGV